MTIEETSARLRLTPSTDHVAVHRALGESLDALDAAAKALSEADVVDSEPVEEAEAVALTYIRARLDLGRRESPEFPFDELTPVLNFVNHRFADHGAILHAYTRIMQEFSEGHRCSVCARTVKQSAAIGYDCAREC